ncbi:hypothetical protein BgiBS90_033785 [Biomphalaria glabrata]|nr:hypothetical protein BgiBS90_033785 [Biomphalaria glabrata]
MSWVNILMTRLSVLLTKLEVWKRPLIVSKGELATLRCTGLEDQKSALVRIAIFSRKRPRHPPAVQRRAMVNIGRVELHSQITVKLLMDDTVIISLGGPVESELCRVWLHTSDKEERLRLRGLGQH